MTTHDVSPVAPSGMEEALKRERVQVGLLVALALTVQLPGVARPGFSGDEEGAVKICREPVALIVSDFHRGQNHPLFSLGGHVAIQALPMPDLYAIRIPALLAGLVIPLAFYMTHRRWCGREAALVVACLLLVADPVHYYATAGRGYAMLVLGVILMNHLLLTYVTGAHARSLVLYTSVGAAAAYAHLWALIVLPGHAVFVITQWLRGEGGFKLATRRLVVLVSTFAVTLLLVLLLYLPMLDEIRSMAGHGRASRLVFAGTLADAVLQLARFRNWTLAAYVVLVPIVLEGLARKARAGGTDDRSVSNHASRYLQLHIAVIFCGLLAAWVAAPWNFFSRFLLGIVPSGAALAAWALSGWWLRPEGTGERALPRVTTLLTAVAIGTVVSNASITMDIPEATAYSDDAGRDNSYFHRDLTKAFAAGPLHPLVLLSLAALGIGFRRWLPELAWVTNATCYILTSLLAVSLVPLLFGPLAFKPRWLFEVHLAVVAAVWYLAWEHRHNGELLLALRWGLLITVVVVAFWQLDPDRIHVDMTTPLRLAAIVPAGLIAVAVARTSDR